MSNDNGFNLDELMDFNKDMLNLIEKQFPKEIPKHMKKEAKTATKTLQKRGRTLVSTTGKNKSYHKSWKAGKKVYEYQGVKYNIRAYNTSPHQHLIEYGHRMVTKDGRMVGYVAGKYVIQSSLRNIEIVYFRNTEQFLEKLIENSLEKGLHW